MGPATTRGLRHIGWILLFTLVVHAAEEDFKIKPEAEYEAPESARAPRGAPGGYGYGMGSMAYRRCSAPEGYPGSCKPRATCANYYSTTAHYDYSRPNKYKSCNYGYGHRGVCCPDVIYRGPRPQIIKLAHFKRPGYDGKVTHVSDEHVKSAITYASSEISKAWSHDHQYGRGEDDPSYWNNGVATELYMKMLHKLGWVGYYISLVTWYLKKEHSYNPLSYYDGGLSLIDNYMSHLPKDVQDVCATYRQYKCNPYAKWRTIDGSCNNLKHPYWGQSYQPTIRIAPPMYSDYVWAIKRAKDGSPLPVARRLRSQILPEKQVADHSSNNLFVAFLQSSVHDTIHTTFYQTNDGAFFDCCAGYKGGEHEVHPKCSAMEVYPDDHYYGPKNVRCVNLARNIIGPNYHCSLGYTNQLSMVTPWVDLSFIYGNYHDEAAAQRSYHQGQLKMSKVGDQYLLRMDPHAECTSDSKFCFGGGDLRMSQNPSLIAIEVLFTRFHNYCATKLWKINPKWDDEFIYQECRRINIAVYQNILYNEALPLLLGWKFMYDHGMLPVSKGYSYGWSEYINPATYGEWSAAAMRCHTSVYEKVFLADQHYNVEHVEPLYKHFNNPYIFAKPENFPKILRGMMYAKMRGLDQYYDHTMVNEMFINANNHTHGFDIGAFNILRGYEYGLRGYNDYREICGLRRAHSWEDFGDWIDRPNIELLKKNYKHWDDVGLYTGGLMERHQYDSKMGPTWWCIVGQQFYNWKVGDNWFFDLGGRPHSFTLPQLDTIRHSTMAALICEVTDIEYVPTFAFHTVSPGNPIISCADYEELPRFNWATWSNVY